MKSRNDARQAELKTGVQADPLVAAVMARFPGAEIVDVRRPDAAPPPLPPVEDDVPDFPADDLPDERDEEF